METDPESQVLHTQGCGLVSYAHSQIASGAWDRFGLSRGDSAKIAFVRLMSLVTEAPTRAGQRDTSQDQRAYYVTMLLREPTRTREVRISERTGQVSVFTTEPIDTTRRGPPK